ncbi:MAG: Minor outer membrane protein Omp16 [Verrucomicrobiales bacterium]|nr:Minor outer membrane protein Omp16 [Verrucomicrobiales bacterium]
MKLNTFKFFVIAIVCVTAVTGCKKKPYLTTIPGQNTIVGPDTTSGNPTKFDPSNGGKLPLTGSTGTGTSIGTDLPPGIDGGRPPISGTPHYEILAAQTIYFAFDSSLIRASEQPKLTAVVTYLKGNAAGTLVIEGHCDERGTEGYNLALGDRRALAVREALLAAGAPADRIQTKTLGESQPADSGHNEAAWSKNRRGVFVVMQ